MVDGSPVTQKAEELLAKTRAWFKMARTPILISDQTPEKIRPRIQKVIQSCEGIASFTELTGALYELPVSLVKEILENLVTQGELEARQDKDGEIFFRPVQREE